MNVVFIAAVVSKYFQTLAMFTLWCCLVFWWQDKDLLYF